jgi:HTH-type transcriptional regulator, sugar sensing transcriptional regulator
MDLTLFQKLGISEKEVKAYLALLELGPLSVRLLAEACGLNRGTAYDALKKLQEVGLASFYHQDTKQKFVAEEPEKILRLITQREQEYAALRGKAAELLPELKSLHDKRGNRPVTKVYEGKAGIRLIMDDLLDTLQACASIRILYLFGR